MPLWNGLARSLNTIAVRVGDLVGASNIFNFVYNTCLLYTSWLQISLYPDYLYPQE